MVAVLLSLVLVIYWLFYFNDQGVRVAVKSGNQQSVDRKQEKLNPLQKKIAKLEAEKKPKGKH